MIKLKLLTIYLISVFARITFSSRFVPKIGTRDEHDLNVTKFISIVNSKKSVIPITAVYRVKNGARYIEASILSIAPLCSEIVVVDNCSTDNTKFIVEKLSNRLKNITSIKYYEYNHKLAKAGKNYWSEIQEYPERSLAKFYDFAFSKASNQYIMKVDAHLIYLPKSLYLIQRKLESGRRDFLKYRGQEIYGPIMGYEFYIYNRKLGVSFVDGKNFEIINFNRKISVLEKFFNTIYSPVFIHIKRLGYVESL
ncbi:glycosyltransferase [Vibrio mimicus]|nr:putative glycosyltransferase [Vibrio mimicus]